MKKIVVICSVLFSMHVSSQTMGEIVEVKASLLPKTKRLSTVIDGRAQVVYKDTAYTLVVTVRTNNLQVGEKLILKVGLSQNDTIALNQKFKVLDKPNNGRSINHDVNPYVEIDEVKSGYVNLFFDIKSTDRDKVKWVTTFVKSDGNNSEKKYYEFQ